MFWASTHQSSRCYYNDDCSDNPGELECHLRQVLSEDLEDNPTVSTVNPQLEVPGVGLVYKSTIVSLLNSNDSVSKDRLKRVQQRADNSQKQYDGSVDGNEVYLYCDIVTTTAVIGRVQRVFFCKQRRIEYVRPVKLDDEDSQYITVLIRLYTRAEDDNKFRYTMNEKEVKLSTIVSTVELIYDGTAYDLSPVSSALLKTLSSKTRRRKISPTFPLHPSFYSN